MGEERARFRKLYPRFWRDEKVMRLNMEEKTVAAYCLTGPQSNRCGIYSFSTALAAEDLGTLPQTFAERFEGVLQTLKWRFDSALRVLYIPTWWKWNRPDNANQLIAALKDLEEVPETLLLQDFAANTRYLEGTFGVTFAKRLGERLAGVRPQEQEQEQEKEQEQERERKSPKTPSPPDWLRQVLFPNGLDASEVRDALKDWFAWIEQRGRPALDPAMEASQLLRCFGTPAEVAASVGYAIGNRCLTLKNYAREHAGRDGGAQRGRPQRPTIDVEAIMRKKAAEKGEVYP
jgi:hypothetical protein